MVSYLSQSLFDVVAVQCDDGVHDAKRVLPELFALALQVVEHSLLEAFALYCENSELFLHVLVDLLYLTCEFEILAVAVDEVPEADAWVEVAYINNSGFFAVEERAALQVPLEIFFLEVLYAVLDDVRVEIDKLDILGCLSGSAGGAAIAASTCELLFVGDWVLNTNEVVGQVRSTPNCTYELFQTHQVNDSLVILLRNALDSKLNAYFNEHTILEVLIDHVLVAALLLGDRIDVD